MAVSNRRNRIRRLPADRLKPVASKPAPPVTPHGKRTSRYIVTALFLAAGILILNLQTGKPTIKKGEIAKRSYKARLDFKIIDRVKTQSAIDRKKDQCPRVFQKRTGHLDSIPRNLAIFLNRILNVKDIENLPDDVLETWGAKREDLRTLKSELDEDLIRAIESNLRRTLQKLAVEGIMKDSDLDNEYDAERNSIIIREGIGADAKELGEGDVMAIIGYPDHLRRVLQREMGTILYDKSEAAQETLIDLMLSRTTPTLIYDAQASVERQEAVAKSVEPYLRTISKDSVILEAGQEATENHIEEIREEARQFAALSSLEREALGEGRRLRTLIYRAVGVSVLFLLGAAMLALYAIRFSNQALSSNTQVFAVYAIILIVLGSVRVLEHINTDYLHWSPLVLAAMVLTVACGQTLAFGVTVLLSILAGVATGDGLTLALPLMVGGIAAILRLFQLKSRTDLFEAGLLAAFSHLIMVWVLFLVNPEQGQPLYPSAAALSGGLLAGFIMAGILPYVERIFDVATDMRLLEWTDQNQPLLRKLALEAPGSYHHSTIVSNMAEAAAEAIGANTLLARTGGYLHDVGKMNRPEYYIENIGGMPNPHDEISPMMSTMILTAHPEDGVEIARSYGVPSPIRRIIGQHHGTTVVEYFYAKAVKDIENGDTRFSRTMFRYRGSLPQCPEAAIVMLADSCESASRSLTNASPNSIEKLVHKIVGARLEDGQLDECRMSITDIRTVEKSLVRSLVAISHPRIRYPSAMR